MAYSDNIVDNTVIHEIHNRNTANTNVVKSLIVSLNKQSPLMTCSIKLPFGSLTRQLIDVLFSTEPFPDPFTFPVRNIEVLPSCRLQPWAASIQHVQDGRDRVWLQRTAFSTFNRSTGHRSSSESNRNERMRSSEVTVISRHYSRLADTSRPIFTAAFMTARPWKHRAFPTSRAF